MVLGLVRDLVLMVRAEEVVLHQEDVVVRVQDQCAVPRALHEVVIRPQDLVVAIPLQVEVDLVLPIGRRPWILTVSAANLLRKATQLHSDG